MSKKPLNVELTEAERDRLEVHRSSLGLRSFADVFRHWIAQEPEGRAVSPERPARRLPNGGGYMAPTGGAPSRPPTGGSAVRLGPAASAPGSRLKKDKKGGKS